MLSLYKAVRNNSCGHFYFGLTTEFRIRDFMLNKKLPKIEGIATG